MYLMASLTLPPAAQRGAASRLASQTRVAIWLQNNNRALLATARLIASSGALPAASCWVCCCFFKGVSARRTLFCECGCCLVKFQLLRVNVKGREPDIKLAGGLARRAGTSLSKLGLLSCFRLLLCSCSPSFLLSDNSVNEKGKKLKKSKPESIKRLIPSRNGGSF